MNKHTGTIIDSKDDIDVIDCVTCGFAHIVPYPEKDALKQLYKEKFFLDRPDYVRRFEEDIEWWNLIYQDRLDDVASLLDTETKRILDIGCGLGLFLKHAKENGWDGVGIEPGQQASQYARDMNLDVRTGFFGELSLNADAPFDAIHVAEVLEHVPNPEAFLLHAKRLLKPGGVVCAVVPNDFNPLQLLLKKTGAPSYWVNPSVHINYFNFETFPRLFERCGFSVEIKDAVYPLEFFLLMGENYIGDDAVGRICHFKRKDFDLKLSRHGLGDFRKAFYRFMADNGVGREIVLYARV